MVFSHNTPNTTLPIVWASQNGWRPLFPRVGRLRGIDSFYKKATQAKASLAQAGPKPRELATKDLILFLESPAEEVIFDSLRQTHNLDKRVGAERVINVSVGKAMLQKPLAWIRDEKGHFVFVLNATNVTAQRREELSRDAPWLGIVTLTFGTMDFLDITKLVAEQSDAMREFGIKFDTTPEHEKLSLIEMFLVDKGLGVNMERTKQLLKEYVSQDALGSFVKRLRAEIERMNKHLVEPKAG